MNYRDIDAKIAVISDKDAAKLGIKKNEENLVTIDGQLTEIEWIDEFGEDWHLPNIVLKAQAYLKTLKNSETKKFVNVYSNKYENFERIVNFDLIEGTSLNKVREFLVANEYGPESAIDEFNYGLTTITNHDDVNKVLTRISDNLAIYQDEYMQHTKELYVIDRQYENFEISDDEYVEYKSDALASLQIISLSIYRDLVLLNSISKKPIDTELVKSTSSVQELANKLVKLDDSISQTIQEPSQPVVNENKKVKTWTIDMKDPKFVNLVEWSPKEFSQITNYEDESKTQQTSNQEVVSKQEEHTFESFEEEDEKEIENCDELKNEPQNVFVAPMPEYDVEMKDPVYYYNNEWTVENSFGGQANKTDSKQSKSKGLFKDLNIFKKKKAKQEAKQIEENLDSFYLVTDINGNSSKISAENKDFKGLVEWEATEFDKENVEKFANFEVLNKNYAELIDKSGTLNQKRRVVTEQEKALNQQINEIKNEIDDLENQLNEIKNK